MNIYALLIRSNMVGGSRKIELQASCHSENFTPHPRMSHFFTRSNHELEDCFVKLGDHFINRVILCRLIEHVPFAKYLATTMVGVWRNTQ
jgi:hypothetical protein